MKILDMHWNYCSIENCFLKITKSSEVLKILKQILKLEKSPKII